jgi:hypothetical protein
MKFSILPYTFAMAVFAASTAASQVSPLLDWTRIAEGDGVVREALRGGSER